MCGTVRFLLCFCIIFAGLATRLVFAGELQNERVWRSPAGKTLIGTYIRKTENGSRIELLTSTGKVVSISMDNLSEADRLLVTTGRADGGGPEPDAGKPGDPAAFKTLPDPDRGKIPVISQEDFGSKASDCVPSSFCNFLLWWDQQEVLKIPKRGDFRDKAEWVHTCVARYCVTRNTSGTSIQKAIEGFRKYFDREIGDLATMKVCIDRDITPGNLSRYAVGRNATMLGMTIREKQRHDSGHWVALVSASPDGNIVFHTWGARFEGRMEVLEKKPDNTRLGSIPATTYRINITNTADLPDWFKNSGRELIMDPGNWDGICVIKPFVYAEQGKRAEAPADPLLDPLAIR